MQNRTDTDKIKTIKNIVCDTINNEIDTESNSLPNELPKDTDKLIEMRHNELISSQKKNENINNENEYKKSWYYYFSSDGNYHKVNLYEKWGEGQYRLALASNMDKAIGINGRKLYGYKKDKKNTDSNSGGKRYQKNKTKKRKNKTTKKTKQRRTKSKSKK